MQSEGNAEETTDPYVSSLSTAKRNVPDLQTTSVQTEELSTDSLLHRNAELSSKVNIS